MRPSTPWAVREQVASRLSSLQVPRVAAYRCACCPPKLCNTSNCMSTCTPDWAPWAVSEQYASRSWAGCLAVPQVAAYRCARSPPSPYVNTPLVARHSLSCSHVNTRLWARGSSDLCCLNKVSLPAGRILSGDKYCAFWPGGHLRPALHKELFLVDRPTELKGPSRTFSF